jgi:hypothetical protein
MLTFATRRSPRSRLRRAASGRRPARRDAAAAARARDGRQRAHARRAPRNRQLPRQPGCPGFASRRECARIGHALRRPVRRECSACLRAITAAGKASLAPVFAADAPIDLAAMAAHAVAAAAAPRDAVERHRAVRRKGAAARACAEGEWTRPGADFAGGQGELQRSIAGARGRRTFRGRRCWRRRAAGLAREVIFARKP